MDEIEAIPEIAALLRMAEQKRLPVATGHAANGCDEGSRPDIIAIEDAIA